MEFGKQHASMLKQACGTVAVLFIASAADAATKYWDVSGNASRKGGDGVWDYTTPNWFDPAGGTNAVWRAGDDAVFNATGAPITYVVTLDGEIEANSISMGSNNDATLTNGVIALGAGGLRNGQSGWNQALHIHSPIVLTSDQTWVQTWSGSVIELKGEISERGGSFCLTLDYSRTGDGHGAQYWFYATNTYSGGTRIQGHESPSPTRPGFYTSDAYLVSGHGLGTGPVYFEGGRILFQSSTTFTNTLITSKDSPLPTGTHNLSFGDTPNVGYDVTLAGALKGDGLIRTRSVNGGKRLTFSGDNSEFNGEFLLMGDSVAFTTPASGSARANWNFGNGGVNLAFGGGRISFGSLNSGQWGGVQSADGATYTVVVGERGEDCVMNAGMNRGNGDTRVEKRGPAAFTLANENSYYRGGTYICEGVLNIPAFKSGLSTLGESGVVEINGGTLQYTGVGGHNLARAVTIGEKTGCVAASGTGPFTVSCPIVFSTNKTDHTLVLAGTSVHGNIFSSALGNPAGYNAHLKKNSPGAWTFTANNHTYAGETTVEDGTLFVDGMLGASACVNVTGNGVLAGVGTINTPVTVENGGRLGAGHVSGTLTISNLVFNAGGVFAPRISGDENCGRVRIPSNGAFSLANAELDVEYLGGYIPESIGLNFGVLQNETGLPVAGIFTGLPERATVREDGNIALKITYTGSIAGNTVLGPGTGNDIVLYTRPKNDGTRLLVK